MKDSIVLTLENWMPDPHFGEFVKGEYVNHRIGYDKLGAAYTVTEVGIWSPKGFLTLKEGDWIVKLSDQVFVCDSSLVEAISALVEKFWFSRGSFL